MYEDFERDARMGKAKIEEDPDPNPNPLLPKPATPKTYRNCGNDVIFIKVVGPPRGPQIDSSESLKKIQFRFRFKELNRMIGKEGERIKKIHSASGATIRILYDTQSKIHRHLYLELLGNANQVNAAEILITDAIKEACTTPFIPRALMPTDISYYPINMFLTQVEHLLGINGINLLKMESDSNTWIEVGTDPPEGKISERVVKIYGKPLDIRNAIIMINNRLAPQYEEFLKVENEETGSGEKSGKMED